VVAERVGDDGRVIATGFSIGERKLRSFRARRVLKGRGLPV
jgi:hypothetical protein